MGSVKIDVLDHGFVRLVEAWGHGDAGVADEPEVPSSRTDYEVGIIEAARQSTQGSFRGWDEDAKLLKYLYTHKHATPFEFSGMVLEVRAPIMVFREWHRHRTQSYNEMSARYAPLPDLQYMPTLERVMMNAGKQGGAMAGADELTEHAAYEFLGGLRTDYDIAGEAYRDYLHMGVPKELARLCMPLGWYSQMRAATCLRNWLSFLTLRQDPAAQWEIRQYANAVGSIVEQLFPRTWELYQRAAK